MPLYMENYLLALQSKYSQEITVKWVWAVVILLSVIGCIGYAVYCSWVVEHLLGVLKLVFPTWYTLPSIVNVDI